MTDRRRYTIADVRRTYRAERAREEWYSDWASALVYRPISFWVTPVLLKLSIGANAVTISMLVLALSLPALAVLMGPDALGAVASMAFVCMVLDCVDGNIARATGTSSDAGAYLDFLADIVYRICVYGTVGYLADAGKSSPAILSGYALATAALAACIGFSARLCRFREERETAVAFYSTDNPGRTGDGAFVKRWVFPALSGADRMLPVLVLAAGWWGGLGWAVLWLLGYGVVDFIYTQVVILERLRARR